MLLTTQFLFIYFIYFILFYFIYFFIFYFEFWKKVPFNIASYSLLTCLLAQVTGLKPGEFVHILGDAHVYKNHIAALEEQLKREPRPFPKLKINPNVTDIEQFKFSDFEIVDYNPYPPIQMDMAV